MKTYYTENDQDEIRQLLLGKRVVKVDDDTLALDDGTTLSLGGNEGCGGCSNGWYWLSELNECPVNAIMAVEFEDDPGYDGSDENTGYYRIFVLAEDRRIKLAEFEGSDGNGYYGTGYWIEVI